jgi:hypothetical protein
MEKTEIITKLCEMPHEFHTRQNISMFNLFLSSGYMEIPDRITTQDLESHLRQFPELINDWQQLSWDNRGHPAWYLDSRNNESNYDSGDWIVGFDLGHKIYEFNNAYQACALYIKQESEQLREMVIRKAHQNNLPETLM